MTEAPVSVFAKYTSQNYPYVFRGAITMHTIAGGTPSDPKVAEAWLKSQLADSGDLIRAQVAEVMAERGIGPEEATKEVDKTRHLNGFRRDEERGLYIEGRQLKAALKESANIAANEGALPAKGWGNPSDGNYKKGLKGWLPEHLFVLEDRLYLGVKKPTGVSQRFVHTHRGAGIQYEEYVEGCTIEFTIETDHSFPEEQWAAIWLRAERNGLGASRSQGFGRFDVVRWEQISENGRPA